MPIKSIELVSFRNHKHVKMDFGSKINLIWGENGSGKTSILEAIHILSIGRSFKTKKLDQTIRANDNNMHLEGLFEVSRAKKRVSFGLRKDGKRRLKLNGIVLSGSKNLIGENPVVVLSPEEQLITLGSPANRRTYFDRVFSTVSRPYLEALSAFTKTLKQRNAALRKEGEKASTIEAWNEPLVRYGVQIWRKRKEFLTAFSEELSAVMKDIQNLSISLRVGQKMDGDAEESWYHSELLKNYRKDQFLGWTSTGPHRDEIFLLFNDRLLKDFGSQGEHKLSLVLIKLAEFGLIHKLTNISPTLLLDDLFAKLDLHRGGAVMELLNQKTQTLITNADLVGFQQHGIKVNGDKNKTFHLVR